MIFLGCTIHAMCDILGVIVQKGRISKLWSSSQYGHVVVAKVWNIMASNIQDKLMFHSLIQFEDHLLAQISDCRGWQ